MPCPMAGFMEEFAPSPPAVTRRNEKNNSLECEGGVTYRFIRSRECMSSCEARWLAFGFAGSAFALASYTWTWSWESPWRPPSLLRQVCGSELANDSSSRRASFASSLPQNRQPGGGSSRDFLSRSSRPAIHGRSPYQAPAPAVVGAHPVGDIFRLTVTGLACRVDDRRIARSKAHPCGASRTASPTGWAPTVVWYPSVIW